MSAAPQTEAGGVPVLEAVTAVLVHGGEVYLARRHQGLMAFPGYQAFPGGKVDPGDAKGEPPRGVLAAQEPRLMRALARELAEELGFDLLAAEQRGELASVHDLGAAQSPPSAPLRFRAQFYRIHLRTRPELRPDQAELQSGEWATAAAWLERYGRGELLLAPPTLIALRLLAQDLHHNGAARFLDFSSSDTMHCIEFLNGLRLFLVRSATLPPAAHTNCFLIGDHGSRRILVDPSPISREEMELLLRTVAPYGFDEVFLTHHHPDHRQLADEIARRAGVPLAMSADTQARIARKEPAFLRDVVLKNYGEGDEITRWLGQRVRVLAVPGHDEGQLALMPDNRAWCIVGDLIQGVGTVVISPPEGNMRKYFASMRRLIDLQPRTIFPSHGVGLGGTHYLEHALHHREMREATIGALFKAGRSVDDILAEVYVGTDPRLMPYARINIDSHLAKLREEGAIA
jgi:glyoxylase-like metal-dependent hydrolase (beta-lactamase superfamily II)/8-oxo-dGTP pyrophosphatase MutT (NUDIX family)